MLPSPEPAAPPVLLVTPETWPYICGTPRDAKLQAWLREHGIEPKGVSVQDPTSIITEPDGTQLIEYTEFLVNTDGHRYLDPNRPNEAAKVVRHAPLRTPPPEPKRSDITTLALLRAIDDHRTRPVPPGKRRWELPGAWWTLCAVYPEKVVTAAYIREDDRGHLDCGVSLRTSWLTDKGDAKLTDLKAGA
ncbi:hypothetical protein [Streptomyces sp. NPDC048445]|uniref:hypothetical protein n=1 Tax=Streptomyces sp. NPDC048445 TaxID=3365553 RepID=UPI003711A5A4